MRESGRPLIRVFSHAFAANAFNPGPGAPEIRGRFHFFLDASGLVVPVLYGSDEAEGAIAETVFHDVPVRGAGRVVFASRLANLSIATLQPTRDLRLVELHGFGLRRLHLAAQHLTDTEAAEYPRTVPWAAAIHRALPHVHGIEWVSRQFNTARALMLFGDRVGATDLALTGNPLPLGVGRGRAMVDAAANAAGIAIE